MADPNHVWLEDRGVVFILPHKSANSSVKLALKGLYGFEHASPHDLCGPMRYVSRDEIPSGCRCVGVIREPWARLCSGWVWNWRNSKLRHDERDPVHFANRVCRLNDDELHHHIRPQVYDFVRDGELLPTRWLVVEHLAEDWDDLCRDYGWPPVEMPHTNRQTPSDYEEVPSLEPFKAQLLPRLHEDVCLYDQACAAREGLVSHATSPA